MGSIANALLLSAKKKAKKISEALGSPYAGPPMGAAGPGAHKGFVGRYLIPAAKGVGRSVGLPITLEPGERGVGTAADVLATAALFTVGVGEAGLALKAARAAPFASRLLARPVVGLAAQTALASGGVETLKQTVRGVTGQGFQPASIAREAAIGGAVPLAFGGAGKVAGGLARRIPGAEKFRLGEAVGAAGKAVYGEIGRVAGSVKHLLGNRQAGGRVGRVAGREAYEGFATGFSRMFMPAERYLQTHGVETTGHDVVQLMNDLGRGVRMNVAPMGARPILTVITGPRTSRGATSIANMADVEAQRLAQISQTFIHATDPKRTMQVRDAAQFHARQLAEGAIELRTLAQRSQVVPGQVLRSVAARIDSAINTNFPELGFLKETGGQTILGDLFAVIRDNLKLAVPGGRVAEHAARTLIAHSFLGVLNPASAGINITAIFTNVGAREGPEATARAVMERSMRGRVHEMVKKYIAKPILAVPSQGLELGSKLAKVSMFGFSKGEEEARVIAGMARYFNVMKGGGVMRDALKQAAQAARQELFDFQWNLPAFLRSTSGGGQLARVLFQFYPFILNQMNFMASMSAVELSRFLTYQMALGGAIAVPFSRVADRAFAMYTGWSMLDRLQADPALWAQIVAEGPTAAATGASLGRRLDFTSDLLLRWYKLGDAPYTQLLEGFATALERAIADPSPANMLSAARQFLAPMSLKRIGEASEAEEVGAFVTQRGLPVAPVTSARDLSVKALGFTPMVQASGQAATGIQMTLRERGRKQTEFWLKELRLSTQSRDTARRSRAVRELFKLGYRREDIIREMRNVRIPPSIRLERGLQKRLRPDVQDLFRKRRAIELPKP